MINEALDIRNKRMVEVRYLQLWMSIGQRSLRFLTEYRWLLACLLPYNTFKKETIRVTCDFHKDTYSYRLFLMFSVVDKVIMTCDELQPTARSGAGKAREGRRGAGWGRRARRECGARRCCM